MNKNETYASHSDTVASSTPDSDGGEHQLSRARMERSRKTILCGWVISMIGIVIYCFVMSRGDQQADLPTALAARGGVGWAAVGIICIGLALWFAGYVGFMKSADFLTDEADAR